MRLVLDWDGTITDEDTLHLVLEEFGDVALYEQAEAELEHGTLTLNQVIAREFASVTAQLDEVVAWLLERTRLRPGFGEVARIHRPLVLSSGFHELIEPLLAREGLLDLVGLRANRVEAGPEGWRVRFRVSEPCPVCGEPCKRGDLPREGEVVYAGDGHSDYCAALAVDRVFATAGLARWLAARGVPFRPLTDFVDLAAELSP
jgi:2-hydroxy-3-keto-5-methylthiopentenyl-1-phosphate phosphatase